MRSNFMNFTRGFVVIFTVAVSAQTPDAKPNLAVGTYVNQASSYDVLDLREDGSFSLTERGRQYGGRYTVSGKDIVLLLPSGKGERATIEGNVIRDAQGQLWAKRSAGEQTRPDPPAASEPEFENEFRYLDSPKHALVPLERHDLAAGAHVGITGSKMTFEVPGSHSPIRLAAGQAQEFVVRLFIPAGVDPNDYIKLYALKSTRKSRQLLSGKAGIFGGKYDGGAGSTVSVAVARYGAASFKITPVAPLVPGEYMLSTYGPLKGFLFGID